MNTATTTDQMIPSVTGIAAISYPEEFLIACRIHQLRPEKFLQQFVNRYNYSGLLCGTEDDIEYEVNEVILDYIQSVYYDRDIFNSDLTLHLKWLNKLSTVKEEGSKLPKEELQANLNCTILACKEEIFKELSPATTVCLPNGNMICLPVDFIVMCFLKGVSAEAVLQHLINNISLAKDAAKNQFGVADVNPFMYFFQKMAKQFFRDSEELQVAGFYQYDTELVALYEKLKEESDYDVRLLKLTKHYQTWYNAIKNITIKPAPSSLYA